MAARALITPSGGGPPRCGARYASASSAWCLQALPPPPAASTRRSSPSASRWCSQTPLCPRTRRCCPSRAMPSERRRVGLTSRMRACVHACVRACMRACVHARMRACAHAHIPAYTHAHIQEARPDELPRIVHESLQRWPQLYQRIERVRSSFVYGLAVQQVGDEPPAVGHAATCDATHAMLSDLQARFPQRAAHAQHMPGYGACLRPPRGARRPPTPCHKSLT